MTSLNLMCAQGAVSRAGLPRPASLRLDGAESLRVFSHRGIELGSDFYPRIVPILSECKGVKNTETQRWNELPKQESAESCRSGGTVDFKSESAGKSRRSRALPDTTD